MVSLVVNAPWVGNQFHLIQSKCLNSAQLEAETLSCETVDPMRDEIANDTRTIAAMEANCDDLARPRSLGQTLAKPQ